MELDIDQENRKYGDGDVSFQAAGGEEGIHKLVNDFYDFMEKLDVSKDILAMHSSNLNISRDKLARFLCGWLGGPARYSEKYGPISIPQAHLHLDIGTKERDAWLVCMWKAIELQPYKEDFKQYLIEQLTIPAERVRKRDW